MVDDTRKAELLPSTSPPLSQIEKDNTELRPARDSIPSQSKELEVMAQLKLSIKSL